MKTKLSGMPELRLGLNDRVQFESTGRANGTIFPFFHQNKIFNNLENHQ